jgi:hypothetical protein
MLLARFRLILEAECLVSELFRCVEDEVFTAYRAIFVEPFALERYVSERIMRRRMDSSVHGQFLVVNGGRHVLDHTVVVPAGAPRAVCPSSSDCVFNVLPVAVDLVWLKHLVHLMFDLDGQLVLDQAEQVVVRNEVPSKGGRSILMKLEYMSQCFLRFVEVRQFHLIEVGSCLLK